MKMPSMISMRYVYESLVKVPLGTTMGTCHKERSLCCCASRDSFCYFVMAKRTLNTEVDH